MSLCVVFFFQAEDGIRDTSVTGVQTCALPIFCTSSVLGRALVETTAEHRRCANEAVETWGSLARDVNSRTRMYADWHVAPDEIGRASCRERVERTVGYHVCRTENGDRR